MRFLGYIGMGLALALVSTSTLAFQEQGSGSAPTTPAPAEAQPATPAPGQKDMNFSAPKIESEDAGTEVRIPGLGKLVIRNYKARMGRNPQTGEAIKIPAKRRLKFVVAKAAKDACLGK